MRPSITMGSAVGILLRELCAAIQCLCERLSRETRLRRMTALSWAAKGSIGP
jgi:hypothetical protein